MFVSILFVTNGTSVPLFQMHCVGMFIQSRSSMCFIGTKFTFEFPYIIMNEFDVIVKALFLTESLVTSIASQIFDAAHLTRSKRFTVCVSLGMNCSTDDKQRNDNLLANFRRLELVAGWSSIRVHHLDGLSTRP